MKRVILCVAIFCGSVGVNNIYAQEKTELQQENILTSIKPADEQPVVFANKMELDQKVDFKIENTKRAILENRNDAVKVRQLREELWRFENAIVHVKK
jgi:hypothetical protein